MQTGRRGDGGTLRGEEWESRRVGDSVTGGPEDGESRRDAEREMSPCRAGGNAHPIRRVQATISPAEHPVSESLAADTFLSPARNERLWERLGEGASLHGLNASQIHGASPTCEPAFQPRAITTNTKLTDLFYLTQEEFSEKFKGSAVKRAKRRGLLRNAIAALADRDDEEATAALMDALNDPEELVRDSAGWALDKIRVEAASNETLANSRSVDT